MCFMISVSKTWIATRTLGLALSDFENRSTSARCFLFGTEKSCRQSGELCVTAEALCHGCVLSGDQLCPLEMSKCD